MLKKTIKNIRASVFNYLILNEFNFLWDKSSSKTGSMSYNFLNMQCGHLTIETSYHKLNNTVMQTKGQNFYLDKLKQR